MEDTETKLDEVADEEETVVVNPDLPSDIVEE